MDPGAGSRVPVSHSSQEPETLIGQFILAHAADDRAQLPVLKELLVQTRWHHANSVIVTVAHEVVNLRWPGSYESDDVLAAARLAEAMAPRSGTVDADAVVEVIRLTLGEVLEPTISQSALVTYRLFVFWAFVRQLGLSRDGIAALVVQAEREAISRGYSPTPAATAGT